jgi:hypothetical protein
MTTGVAEICGAEPLVDLDVWAEPEGPTFLYCLLDGGYIEEGSSDENDVDETSYSLFDDNEFNYKDDYDYDGVCEEGENVFEEVEEPRSVGLHGIDFVEAHQEERLSVSRVEDQTGDYEQYWDHYSCKFGNHRHLL